MALDLEILRAAAERVAASHGLTVVEVEFAGSGKQRGLRIFIEKTAEERAKVAAKIAAAVAARKAAAGDRKVESKVKGKDIDNKEADAGSKADSQYLAELEGEQDFGLDEEDDGAELDLDEADLDLDEAADPEWAGRDQLAGVTHQDCEQFSRDFGTLLDVEALVPGDEYTLEVSSPGLDRKLYTPADYLRFAGNLVKVQTRQTVSGNRHWLGRLVEVGERGFSIDLAAGKQKGKTKKGKAGKPAVTRVEVEFGNVEKANLEPEI